MITREKAREVANTVIKERETRAISKAVEFVDKEVAPIIEKYAKEGLGDCIVFVPSHLDRDCVYDEITRYGYTVQMQKGYGEFKIFW